MPGTSMTGNAMRLRLTDRPPRQIVMAVLVLVIVIAALFVFSEYWWLFLMIGCLLTAVSFFIPETKTLPSGWDTLTGRRGQIDMTTNPFVIPQNWDPAEIGIQVRRLQSNSSMVRVFVDSVVKRFVIGQDTQTARVRIEFLKNKLEELKLSKELQSSLDELEFRDLNLEIQQLELDKKKTTLKMEADRQKEILDLERQRDSLKLKLEIAGLTKQMDEVTNPTKSAPVRSAEDIKKEKRGRVEQEIRDYEQQVKEIQADTSLNDDARRRRENIISKKLELLSEELERYV